MQSLTPPQKCQTTLAAIRMFSKNFLPCLFNVYGATAVENRPFVIKAIEAFVAIADPSVCPFRMTILALNGF